MLFFFNDTATTEIYTLSLHDALPILFHTDAALKAGATREEISEALGVAVSMNAGAALIYSARVLDAVRSEEHTSELQSHLNLVCRLLLEKKKKTPTHHTPLRASDSMT